MSKADDGAVMVFTSETKQTILDQAGSLGWVLSRKSVEQRSYLVCCRRVDWNNKAEGIPSRTAFLVGRISSLTPLDDSANSRGQVRFRIGISEFAEVMVADVWRKELRNPVAYASLRELGLAHRKLKFQRVGDPPLAGRREGLTIADAKKGLAASFGVRPEDVEITIKG